MLSGTKYSKSGVLSSANLQTNSSTSASSLVQSPAHISHHHHHHQHQTIKPILNGNSILNNANANTSSINDYTSIISANNNNHNNYHHNIAGGSANSISNSNANTNSHQVANVKFSGFFKDKIDEREKYLTAKYPNHQMALIKKRLKVEFWIDEQLKNLFDINVKEKFEAK
jgi:16S rRNA C1402 (ribose-2'-O) methylase RsmI